MTTERSKLNLRLPADLYADAVSLAQAQGISLNAFLTLGIRNWVAYQSRSMRAPAGLQPTTAKASTRGAAEIHVKMPYRS